MGKTKDQAQDQDQDLEVNYRGRYHWGADQEFWRNPDISCTAKIVWILLRSAATMRDGARISVLSKWTNRHKTGIIRDLDELIEKNYLTRKFDRCGAIITKTKYTLFDTPTPGCLENSDFARSRKNGLRVTESVKQTKVSTKSVKSKSVKSSSPTPPQPEEEEKVEKLPPPFSTLSPSHLREASKLCKLNKLSLMEQCEALKNNKIDKHPGHYLLTILRNGGMVGAAEISERVKKAETRAAATRKLVAEAQVRGEQPRWERI